MDASSPFLSCPKTSTSAINAFLVPSRDLELIVNHPANPDWKGSNYFYFLENHVKLQHDHFLNNIPQTKNAGPGQKSYDIVGISNVFLRKVQTTSPLNEGRITPSLKE